MKINETRVLVTGAGGFIGSHLVEALVSKECRVRAFVDYNSFSTHGWIESLPENLKSRLEIVAGDVRDSGTVREAVKGCEAIFHLAALIGIPYSYRAPESYFETNVRGSMNIFQAARDFGVKKIVHTSTSEVYGTAQFVPITEEHPLSAQSPYAASKIAADQMALSFHRAFDLPVAVIRPFNTYGPRQSARAVIPTIITQIASGREEISLGALDPTRDFNYVTDTAAGFIAIAESDQSVGEVLNIGSGYDISIRDTVSVIARLMNKKVRVREDIQRLRPGKSEVQRLLADNSKAKRLTSWSPKYAGPEGFERGLSETIRWFIPAENLMRYKPDTCNL